MRPSICIAVGVSLFGCGVDGPTYVADFSPPAAMDGYTRFITPIVKDLAPSSDNEYCQWIAPAADTAQDVLDLVGWQSHSGHHVVLYATSETQFAVGETHLCTEQDMLSISFVGAIGGEGNASATKLPDGLFFRLPAGKALMANTHWLNATDKVLDGQAVVDVKFAPESDQRVAADLFANNGDTFEISSGVITAFDVNCVLGKDLSFVMAANHMHGLGATAYSELIHPDGSKLMLRQDMTWSPEWQFNPQYERYTIAAPIAGHAGDTYHTHCEWNNTTTKTVLFPDEMCTGVGFYFPSQGQIACENGGWPAH